MIKLVFFPICFEQTFYELPQIVDCRLPTMSLILLLI